MESFTPDISGKENGETISSEIRLHFMRHDEKEDDAGKTNEALELTPEGRTHAKEIAVESDLSQSMAFGSGRVRSAHTAALRMSGKLAHITGEEEFADLQKKLDEGIDYGSSVAIDPRLDFHWEGDDAYLDAAKKAHKEKRLLHFLVHESDALAKQIGSEASTYSSQAAGIAAIIKKYMGIAPRWDELVNDSTKVYSKTLERYLGTHQTIPESFLAKIIEKTKGVGERDRFVDSLHGEGFGYGETFTADIITQKNGEAPVVHISFKKEGKTPEENFEFNENVQAAFIEEIALGK